MFKIDAEFIQRHVRIALFAVAGWFMSRGMITQGMAETLAGFGVGLATYGWSLWGNRLVAKINSVVQNPNFIVIGPPDVTAQVASPSAIANNNVIVQTTPAVAKAVSAENPNVTVVASGKL